MHGTDDYAICRSGGENDLLIGMGKIFKEDCVILSTTEVRQ